MRILRVHDNHDKIEKVASALAAVWREGGVLPVMAEEWLPVDMTEAFAMQDALHGKLGYEMVGWHSTYNDRSLVSPCRTE